VRRPSSRQRSDGLGSADDIAAKLQALEQMDHATLRAEWRRLYRTNPPRKVTRNLLLLAVAWKIQEQAFGGLAAATRRRLADLAETLERDGDVTRSRVARLRPGAKLVREWHGKTHTVIVCEDGFEWKGRHWRSISVIARAITGGHWSGPRFFGLNEKARSSSEDEVAETADA
jgi:Protein of unknown function (DUF2924)